MGSDEVLPEVPANADLDLAHAISRLEIHDHACLIYETRPEQFAAAFPFVKTGLARGEKCLYIADDNQVETVIAGMVAVGLDARDAIRSGKLVILSGQESTFTAGTFDPEATISFLRQAIEEAKAQGFAALRVTGEMTWVLGAISGVERLLAYVAKLNAFIPKHEVVVLCQFSLVRFSPEIIKHLLMIHPLVIFGGKVHKNLYYVSPVEFPGPRCHAQEVVRLLNAITNLTKTEDALQQSDARYLAIIEDQTELICRYLPDGKLSFVNEAYLRYFGKRRHELLGKNFIPHIPPADLSTIHDRLGQITLEKPIVDFEHRVILPGGEVRFQHWIHRGIFSREARLVEYQAVGHDITERVQAATVLRVRGKVMEWSFRLPLGEFLQNTLDEIEALTESAISFFHLIEPDQMTIRLQAWSTNTLLHLCSVKNIVRQYPIAKAGVWIDCVRSRTPVIHNDYPSLPHRKGLPAGHAPVLRELVVPILRNDQVVAVLGVGNKRSDYRETDVRLVTQVADLTWDIVERKLAEEHEKHALREKEILLKEIHHRVKNNLQLVCSLLNLQAKNLKTSEARAILEASRDRVLAIALVHQKLYQTADLAHIDYREYLVSLLREIAATFNQRHVAVAVEMEPITLDVTAAIPCALIVNELVTNAFKHAFPLERPGRIVVGLVKKQGEYVLTVADNGVGLPTNLDVRGASSFGLQLVQVLAGQLYGEMQFLVQDGNGVRVTFPAASA